MKKFYFVLPTPATAWRIEKPTWLMRLLMKMLGWEIFSITPKNPDQKSSGAWVYEYGYVKQQLTLEFQAEDGVGYELDTTGASGLTLEAAEAAEKGSDGI